METQTLMMVVVQLVLLKKDMNEMEDLYQELTLAHFEQTELLLMIIKIHVLFNVEMD